MRVVLRRSFRFLIVLLVILAVAFFFLRKRYDSLIVSLSETSVKNATSDLINDSIDEQIRTGNIQYDRIVYFEKDLNGGITALKTNMSEINRLKTSILNIINDEILALDTTDVGIPIGSFILPELLSGKGPCVPVKVLSIRNSDASFESSFSEAGINQTLHRLNMNISVDIAVLVLGKTESFTVTSQVVVAETVIVGQVPEAFLQMGEKNGSIREN